jgi:hypothetical protein
MSFSFKCAALLIISLSIASISGSAEGIISSTKFHLPGHSRHATIDIVMTDGRNYSDDQEWCGQGEKWEGQFEFRVRIGRRLLSKASVNKLYYPKDPTMPMSFWSPRFKLVMRDYNHDGLLDFNLGQYGACIYNEYRIFTVERNGVVRELPVSSDEPYGLTVSWAHHENSTWRVTLSRGYLTTSSYNRQGADIIEQRAWKRHRFVLLRSKLADYNDDREDENGPKW